MCHSCVFGLGIFEILSRWQLWPSFGSPCAFFLHGKIFTWTVRGLEIITLIITSCSFASSRVQRCAAVAFSVSGSLRFLTGASFGSLSELLGRFSRVEKSLPGQCVDSRLSSILCSLVPLHPRAFRDVPNSRCWSRNLWDPQQATVLALSRISSRVFHARKDLYLDCAWIGDCHLYHAVLFIGNTARLEMCHSHNFGLKIFWDR